MKRISGLLLILLLSFCGGSDVSINESSISPSSTTTTTVAGSTTSSSTTTTTVAGSTTSSSTTTTLLFQPIITLKNCPNTVTADQ